MIEARVVTAEVAHIDAIAARARPADVTELWAQARSTPAESMARGLAGGVATWTGFIGDVPACMFGVVPYSLLAGQGCPWMVGTVDLAPLAAQKALLRESRPALTRMTALFPALLFNTVDDRNTAAKRWLRWLGFTLLEPAPIGRGGEAFRPFYLVGEDSHV